MCLSCFISLGQSIPIGTEHLYGGGIAQGGQVFSLFCTKNNSDLKLEETITHKNPYCQT